MWLVGMAVGEGIKYVANKVLEGISRFIGFVKNAWNRFVNFLGSLIAKVFDFISNWLSSVVQQIVGIFNKIGNLINSLREKIYVATNGIYTAIFTASALLQSQRKVSQALKDSRISIESVEQKDIGKAVINDVLSHGETEISTEVQVSEEERQEILRNLGLDPQIGEMIQDGE
jgi:phage-related protein